MSMMHFDAERELLSPRVVMKYLVDESLVSPGKSTAPPFLDEDISVAVINSPKNLVVQASLPGFQAEELEITLQGETLTIASAAFSRVLALPCPVQREKAEATFEHHLLMVTLPKAEEVGLHSIKLREK
jgi:HSP20 family protein